MDAKDSMRRAGEPRARGLRELEMPRGIGLGRNGNLFLRFVLALAGVVLFSVADNASTATFPAQASGESATLRIVKIVEDDSTGKPVPAEDFHFEVLGIDGAGQSVLAEELRPVQTDEADRTRGEIIIDIPLEGQEGRLVRVQELPFDNFIPFYSGDCNLRGEITVLASRLTTCTVTNRFVFGTIQADSLLTLHVLVEAETAEIGDFFYDIVTNDASMDVLAKRVQASDGPRSEQGQPSAEPEAEGEALIGLNTALNGESFLIDVVEAPPGWTTVFSGDCAADGTVVVLTGSTPTCAVNHLFIGQDLNPDAALLRIVKLVEGQGAGEAVLASGFKFDVLSGNGDPVVEAEGLVPSLTDSSNGAYGEVIVEIDVEGQIARGVRVVELPTNDHVPTFSGDCSFAGEIVVTESQLTTCVVTNTFVAGSLGSNSLLLLNVDVATSGADTSDFFYDVFVDEEPLGAPLANDVQATGGPGNSGGEVPAPSRSGSVFVPLDTTQDGKFLVRVDDAPAGWATVFSGDCQSTGVVEVLVGATKTCTITHSFIGQDVSPAQAFLRIVKVVDGSALGKPVLASTFAFDVFATDDGHPLFGGLSLESQEGNISEAEFVVEISVKNDLGRGVRVEELPVPDYLPSFSGGCDSSGVIFVPVGQLVTCVVTNTYLPDSAGANVLLTLEVSVDSTGANLFDFLYNVRDPNNELVLAHAVSASDAKNSVSGASPALSTQGTAQIGLTAAGSPLLFSVEVITAPDGWATLFSGDCAADGTLLVALTDAPVCQITHVLSAIPDKPQPEPPTALNDFFEDSHAFIALVDVLANDSDPEGNLDPTSLSIVSVICLSPAAGCGTAEVTPDQNVLFKLTAPAVSADVLYEICDTGGLCDSAVIHLDVGADIIATPASVADDSTDDPPGATNDRQQAFWEQQNVVLPANLAVDQDAPAAGGLIAAGTCVNSFMIFLNTDVDANGDEVHVEDLGVIWTFANPILGVMSDHPGLLETASNALLGADGTFYPGTFFARGLEGIDIYFVVGNRLTLSMAVTEPGDWIRVLTECD